MRSGFSKRARSSLRNARRCSKARRSRSTPRWARAPSKSSARMQRLDEAVVARTGVTRSQARSLIMEGRVRVGGEPAAKAGQRVRDDDEITVDAPRRFVSRGGEKLEAALDAFGIDVSGMQALDV